MTTRQKDEADRLLRQLERRELLPEAELTDEEAVQVARLLTPRMRGRALRR